MNILDFLLGNLLPISSATLSLIAALTSTIVTRKSHPKSKMAPQNIHVKINDHEIKLEGLDEKEVIELLEKLNAEKNKNKTEDLQVN